MLRRLILMTVTAAWLCALPTARAQDNPWSGEPGRYTPWQGNGMWPPYGGYPAMSTPYGSSPNSPYSAPPPLTVPNGPPPVNMGSRPAPQTVYEFLPEGDTRGPHWLDAPEREFFRKVGESIWFRAEYLNYSLSDPGSALLGSNYINADVRNPLSAAPNVIFARERDGTIRTDIGGQFLIVAQAHDLSPFDFNNRNGVRLTAGLPTQFGGIEGSVWSMQKGNDSYSVAPQIQQGLYYVIPAITLTHNGQLVDPFVDPIAPMILFDNAFGVRYSTELGGADFNFLTNAINPGAQVKIQLLAGGRFIRLAEDLSIAGADLRDQLNPQLLSTSRNYIFGPSIAARAEWESHGLLVGAQTRFTAAFNRHEDLVRTVDLFPDNPIAQQSTDAHTEFAPVLDLSVYAQLQVTRRLKVRVGYDLMALFQVSRPGNTIVWDDSGSVGGPILIKADSTNLDTFRASGLSVSGEITLY